MSSAPLRLPGLRPGWNRYELLRGVGLVAAPAAGALAVLNPVPVTLGVVAASGLISVVLLWHRLPKLFLGFLAVVLMLYAVGGRGMAYLGVNPIFIGEIVLVLGVLAILTRLNSLRLTVIHVAVLAFMAWGAVRTLPFVSVHGLDALRDAVTWGYGVFAVAVAATLLPDHFKRIVHIYGRSIVWFLPWVPVAAVLYRDFYSFVPTAPGSPVPLLVFKGGDMGVHLAGIAAFLLVGLYWTVRPRVPDLWNWMVWLLALGMVGSINRGGMVAAASAGIAFLFNRSFSRFAGPIVAAVLLLMVVLVVNPQVDVGGSRVLSMSQVIENVSSIFSDEDAPDGLAGTVRWRQMWWDTIFDYTFYGPYFWDGKGFGVNLANEDGFQVDSTESLRSPHNGHVEILARMGVPGLVLWVIFLAVFAVSVLRAALLSYRRGSVFWTGVLVWLLVYWLAALINASFDPYLQGPQGGIWFWSVTGAAIVAMRGAAGATSAELREAERPFPMETSRRTSGGSDPSTSPAE